MGKAAKAVDNVGTIALIDAAKAAGVSKVVLVSSILTDAGAWGQRGSAGFQVTNAFGGVLDEKLVAERYLRASGLDYTIVRPGGLKATPPSGDGCGRSNAGRQRQLLLGPSASSRAPAPSCQL